MSRAILYRTDFEPIVNIGDAVAILGVDKVAGKFFEVLWVGEVPELLHDFGNLSSGDTKTEEIDEVKLNDYEFGQWRIEVVSNLVIQEVRIGGEQAIPLWRTKNYVGYLSRSLSYPNLGEFFSYEDQSVYMKVKANENLTNSYIKFMGFIYVLEPIGYKPEVYTRIPIGGRR